MSEFRAALQALVELFMHDRRNNVAVWVGSEACYECQQTKLCAFHFAQALLARPEPEPVLTYDQFWERVRETGWNPSPEQLRAQLIAAEPEPRITREEAMRLIDSYYECKIDPDRAAEAEEDYEACLSAMLRSEPTEITAEKPAIPRMKPRTVPLDEYEIAREWRPIASAPKDSTPIILLVRADDDSKPTEDHDYFRTIGHNSFDDDGQDWWEMAGWCWSHDHYTETSGTPIAWMQLPSPPAASEITDYRKVQSLPCGCPDDRDGHYPGCEIEKQGE